MSESIPCHYRKTTRQCRLSLNSGDNRDDVHQRSTSTGRVVYTLGPTTNSGTAHLITNATEKMPHKASDIAFSLHARPFLIAQINTLQLEATLENPEPHFVLNHSQYCQMMDASHSFHTLFIIHCGTLDITLGLSPFSYVSRADLHAEQITALKQTEQTKTRYCLPLHILKPL